MSEDIVIVAAGRTAVGTFGGALSAIPASELGATVIKGLLERSGLKPEQINEVIQSFISQFSFDEQDDMLLNIISNIKT